MGGNYSHTTRAAGTILTADIFNSSHQNHIDNATPAGLDDYASTVAQLQSTADPGEVGTESLPTSLAGELERLRWRVKELGGTSQWYETGTGGSLGDPILPASTLAGLPAAGTAGRRRRLTDDRRGISSDTGFIWAPRTRINVLDFVTGGDGSSGTPWTGWETALNALTGARAIWFPVGSYAPAATFAIRANWWVEGDGLDTILLPTSAVSTAVTQASGSVLHGMTIDGVNIGSGKTGLSIGASAAVNDGSTRYVIAQRFTGASGRGLLLEESVNWRFDNFGAWDNEDGAVLFDTGATTPTTTTFTHCTFKSNDKRGFSQQSGTQTRLSHCLFELNGEEGAYINDTGQTVETVSFLHPYFEGNQQDLASGVARHAAYQLFARARGLTIRDGYFFGNANEARAAHLEAANEFTIDHTTVPSESGQILIDNASRGSFVNWLANTNGEFQTTVTDSSTVVGGVRLIDALEGTWTPVITFATPGDLAVTYSVQDGQYTRIGNLVTVRANIQTATFTHTTASGALRVTGLPYTSEATANKLTVGQVIWQGITKAGYTSIGCRVGNNLSYIAFVASASGSAASDVAAADMPTTGAVVLQLTITYEIP